MSINSYLAEILGELTGGDWTVIEAVVAYGQNNPDQVEKIIRERRYPMTTVLAHDLSRAYNGLPPEYFVDVSRLIADFRSRRGISVLHASRSSMMTAREAAEKLAEELAAETTPERVSAWFFGRGIACPREQTHFYASPEWKSRAKVVRTAARMRCEACGVSNVSLEVHHLSPIYSAYSTRLSHNFDVIRLQALCQPCHRERHRALSKQSWGFIPIKTEEVPQERERMRRLIAAHDEAQTCRWCTEQEGIV